MSDSVNIAPQKQNDEIDLIELIQTLWKNKWKIVGSAVVCTAIAAGYAFTAKEQWTSKATVIQPKITELGNLLPIRAEYARITENGNFSANGLAKDLFDSFVFHLRSNDLKRTFLEESDWFKTNFNNKTEQEKNLFISNLVNKYLIVTVPNDDKDKNKKEKEKELENFGVSISLSMETPEDAKALLMKYIEFINQYTINENNKDFNIGFNLHLDNLKFNKERITASLDETKSVTVENLTKALDTAKKAGITDFSKSMSNVEHSIIMPSYLTGEAKLNISDSKLADGTYLFMLGEKYLQAQLDIAKNTGVTYPLDYYRIERELTQLEPLSKQLDSINNVKSYYYLASPDYPITKDKPKRVIILLLGFFIGMFIAMVTIIITNLLYKK